MDERRKRLRFRAWRRGFRELDLLMGAFADARIEELSEARLDEFERLLEAPDQDVYAWITGAAPLPPAHDTATFDALRAFHLHAKPGSS